MFLPYIADIQDIEVKISIQNHKDILVGLIQDPKYQELSLRNLRIKILGSTFCNRRQRNTKRSPTPRIA